MIMHISVAMYQNPEIFKNPFFAISFEIIDFTEVKSFNNIRKIVSQIRLLITAFSIRYRFLQRLSKPYVEIYTLNIFFTH